MFVWLVAAAFICTIAAAAPTTATNANMLFCVCCCYYYCCSCSRSHSRCCCCCCSMPWPRRSHRRRTFQYCRRIRVGESKIHRPKSRAECSSTFWLHLQRLYFYAVLQIFEPNIHTYVHTQAHIRYACVGRLLCIACNAIRCIFWHFGSPFE